MFFLRALALSGLTLPLLACPTRDIRPLVGEDPEVSRLLGGAPEDDPRSSALGAARRLHQALVQNDTETTWSLLSSGTRRALDERGAVISTSGRELIDDSTLPAPSGAVRKVRYETLFFGANLVDLKAKGAESGPQSPGARRLVTAVQSDASEIDLDFVLEEDGWKLERTSF
jgi:hypothetical protein